ncbi:MAG: PPC domain-containing DNA-binding protein [Burkholderiales bacterium]
MRTKVLGEGESRTIALVFDSGDEVVSTLERFAQAQGLDAAHFTAIGAFSRATLGYFSWEKKEYLKIPVGEQVEVLTLAGDIALQEGKRKVHAHVVLGRRDGSTVGGHLLEAYVRPTLELMLTESPAHLKRAHDPETGLALIRIES